MCVRHHDDQGESVDASQGGGEDPCVGVVAVADVSDGSVKLQGGTGAQGDAVVAVISGKHGGEDH